MIALVATTFGGAGSGTVSAAASAPDIRLLAVPSGATVGERIDADVSIHATSKSVGIGLELRLPAGMRPISPPQDCSFQAEHWLIHCRVGSMARDEWRTYRLPLMVTGSGFQSLDAYVLRDGEVMDHRPASVAVEVPETVVRYAPQFRFADGEIYWPMSVRHFIEDSELLFVRHGCGPDQMVRARGEVDPAQLGLPGGVKDELEPKLPSVMRALCGQEDARRRASQNTRPGGRDEFYQPAQDPGSSHGFALSLHEDSYGGEPPQGTADGVYDADVPLYYQYRPGSPERGPGYIRYWVFSGCSELTSVAPNVLGAIDHICWHEGDWEGVAIRLSATTNEPTSIVYYIHDTRMSLPFDTEAIELVEGTHPVVWVAEGSHASYPAAGEHPVELPAPVPDLLRDLPTTSVTGTGIYKVTDVTGDDWRWNTWEGRLIAAEGEPWYGFGGAWGNTAEVARQANVFGPGGPGLVDPLARAWRKSGIEKVKRCDPGEVHPESAGTTSCAPIDYATWHWRQLPMPITQGSLLDVITLTDGRVLALGSPQAPGGWCSTNIADPPDGFETSIFDPATDSWSTMRRTKRVNDDPIYGGKPDLVALPDGGVYVRGSYSDCRHECDAYPAAERLDPKSGRWQLVDEPAGGVRPTSWSTSAGRVLGDTYDYDRPAVGAVYELDLGTWAWELKQKLPKRLATIGYRMRQDDGSIWFLSDGDAERYVTDTGTSVRLGRRKGQPATNPMWALPDGRLLVRIPLEGQSDSPRTAISAYDPATGTTTKPRKYPFRQVLIEALPDGRVLFGRNYEETCPNYGAYDPTSALLLFDPITGGRTKLPKLSAGIYNGSGVVLEDGRILVMANSYDGVSSFVLEPQGG